MSKEQLDCCVQEQDRVLMVLRLTKGSEYTGTSVKQSHEFEFDPVV